MSKINVGKVSPVPKGNWGGANAAYEKLNMVNYNGVLYIAKQDIAANSNIAITNTNYWMKATNNWGIGTVNTINDSTASASASVSEGNSTNLINLTIPRGAFDTEIIDDNAGSGDTTHVWSAEKIWYIINSLLNKKSEKNLLNLEAITNANSSGLIYFTTPIGIKMKCEAASYRSIYYDLEIEKNQTYTISANRNSSVDYGWIGLKLSEDGITWPSSNTVVEFIDNYAQKTISTGNNSYIRIAFFASGSSSVAIANEVYFYNIMFEKGNKTLFEPYKFIGNYE